MNIPGFKLILADKIEKIHRLLRFYIFLKIFSSFFLPAMFICGSILIALRYFKIHPAVTTLLFALSFSTTIVTTIVAYRKNLLNLCDTAAWIDKECGFGGFIMSAFSGHDLSNWDCNIDPSRLPNCDCRWGKILFPISVAIAFLAMSAFVPIPEPDENYSGLALDVSTPSSNLLSKIKILEDTGIIDEERKNILNDTLENLRKNNSALQPGKIYESLDNLDSNIMEMGDEAIRKMAEASKIMQDMELATAELSAEPDENLEKTLRDQAKQLSDLFKGSQALAGICAKGGTNPEDMINAVTKMAPPSDSKMLEKLGKMLKNSCSNMNKSYKKLSSGNCSSSSSQSLKEFFDRNPAGKLASDKGKCNGKGLIPGQGGVNRGRGDAPMIFGDESAKLESKKSPEQINTDETLLDFNETIGVSFSEPESSPLDDGVNGTLGTSTGSGGESRRYPVAPSNRSMLKRYFKH